LESIRKYINEVRAVLDALPQQDIRDVVDVLLSARAVGSTIFTLGNGGSAATASHFACDLAKGTAIPGQPRFRVVALTDNVPLLTAWSNDVAYQDAFAEPLAGLMTRGDVVVAFSGSGNSPNVLRAIRVAQQMGGITIGFSGFDGGQLSTLVDVPVVVPCSCMEQIEDVHLTLCHMVCTVLRERLKQIELPLSLMLDTAHRQAFTSLSTTAPAEDDSAPLFPTR
jgi:D-sedoheptulose 7-phosphate isomerase